MVVALNDQGAPIPGRRDSWMPDTVAQILANPAYIAKTYTESRQKRKGDLIDAQWPPIVTVALYQRVQARLKSFRVPVTTGGSRNREFTFRGLLWCSCGERMWMQWTGGKAYVYCGSRRRDDSDCPHARRGIVESELTPWVDRLMDGIEVSKISGRSLVEHQRRQRETAAEAIAKIDGRIKRLGDRYETDEIDQAYYRTKLAEYRRQRETYAAAAADEPDPAELDGIVPMWRSGDPATRRAALVALFGRLTVQDRRIVAYTPRADRANRVCSNSPTIAACWLRIPSISPQRDTECSPTRSWPRYNGWRPRPPRRRRSSAAGRPPRSDALGRNTSARTWQRSCSYCQR